MKLCTSLQGIALPPGTQFIPMIFRASDATEANLKAAKSTGAGIVLGFNEPNEKAQADNTVAVSPGHLSTHTHASCAMSNLPYCSVFTARFCCC